MKPYRILQSVILAGALLASAAAASAEEDSLTTLKFSDPSKPGTLKIDLMLGDVRVVGADTNEITVRADTPIDDGGKKRKDGLRSIGGGGAYRIVEKDNVVTIDAGDMFGGHGHGMSDFEITVPRSTSVVLSTMHGGDTVVRGLTGDVEVSNQNGDMHLEDLSGGVAADTMNGEIRAEFAKLSEGKTYSFASMNGEIDLRVPANAKASVRFRAQVGEILTDFEENELVTKLGPKVVVEGRGTPAPAPAPKPTPSVDAAPAPTVDVSVNGVRIRAPRAPRPPSHGSPFGGQVVTGDLNGGGPELIATTMRGTITLRKAD
ncbi:MAG TPA: DUF4097 family beta strand repeat-containing protein [Opitutaceae bacterium]|nr:DUF4097 family beta strand repeat-containing protein [Opitutaceae bacterium]